MINFAFLQAECLDLSDDDGPDRQLEGQVEELLSVLEQVRAAALVA